MSVTLSYVPDRNKNVIINVIIVLTSVALWVGCCPTPRKKENIIILFLPLFSISETPINLIFISNWGYPTHFCVWFSIE